MALLNFYRFSITKLFLLKWIYYLSGLVRRCLLGRYVKVYTQLSVLCLAILNGCGERFFRNTKEHALAIQHVHLGRYLTYAYHHGTMAPGWPAIDESLWFFGGINTVTFYFSESSIGLFCFFHQGSLHKVLLCARPNALSVANQDHLHSVYFINSDHLLFQVFLPIKMLSDFTFQIRFNCAVQCIK